MTAATLTALEAAQVWECRFACNCGLEHHCTYETLTVISVDGDRATVSTPHLGYEVIEFEIYQYDNGDGWGTYWAYGSDADPIVLGCQQ